MTRLIWLDDDLTPENGYNIIERLWKLDKESNDPIPFYISTFGGSGSACFGIVDAMRAAKSPIITIGCGKIMSAGAVLLSSGTEGKRYMCENARLMAHQPRGFVELTGTTIAMIKSTRDSMYELLAANTNKSVMRLHEDLELDMYLTATEAMSYGFVDNIIK